MRWLYEKVGFKKYTYVCYFICIIYCTIVFLWLFFTTIFTMDSTIVFDLCKCILWFKAKGAYFLDNSYTEWYYLKVTNDLPDPFTYLLGKYFYLASFILVVGFMCVYQLYKIAVEMYNRHKKEVSSWFYNRGYKCISYYMKYQFLI